MTHSLQTRCKNMILGALVADAAAMGLHWIYDQSHIRKLAPEAPEFRTPRAQDYEGVPAYFAHPTRTAGAQSQYGEQALVMLRTLAAGKGRYSAAAFAGQFRAHFGYGGSYVGYIDHATRDTLDNLRRFEDAAAACASTIPFEGEPRVRSALVNKALALMETHEDAELHTAYLAAVQESYTDESIADFATALLPALTALPRATGARDLQLPATAKLPALVAALVVQGITIGEPFNTQVASAIRTTNDHPVAAEFGLSCAHLMRAALTEGTSRAAVEAARTDVAPDTAALLDAALGMIEKDNVQVTKHFGMACDLPFGVPSAVHNIATAPTFTDAVRRNIYAGGDSCGRAILVGAVMGAVHGIGGAQGIPPEWIARLHAGPEVENLLSDLFD